MLVSPVAVVAMPLPFAVGMMSVMVSSVPMFCECSRMGRMAYVYVCTTAAMPQQRNRGHEVQPTDVADW